MFSTSWLSGVVAEFVSNRTKQRNSIAQESKSRPPEFGRLEELENRTLFAAFTAGDIAVLQLAGTGNNTTGTVEELAPSGAAQTPALSVGISASSAATALRFSDSGTSSFLSDTNDGSLLVLSGYNTTDTTDSNLATVTTADPATDRAVGTLDSNQNFTLQTTYTGISGNQTRAATSPNDSNWYITDKGGLYTNGATSPSLTTNILNARTFGGTVYVSSTAASAGVSTVSSPSASSLTGLPGLPADSKIQDFYLVQSGQNGSTYDVLYTLDQGTSTATINKFYLNNGSWTAEGSYAVKNAVNTAINATGMIAASNGLGGFNLYVVTTAQSAGNAIAEYTDGAAYNATINVTAAPVTLYTANPSSATLKGIAFAPDVAVSTTTAVTTPNENTANPATLTATVTAGSGSGAPTAGSVQFYSGSTLLGTATSETTSGAVATFTFTGTLSVGSYSNIQADYISGGGGFISSNSVAASGPTVTVSAPPTVTSSTTQIGTNATTLTITGTNFSSTAANDSVAFNLGAVGSVTAATATSLTIGFATDPSPGNLTAVVTVSSVNSGSPVQVATVVAPPTVTQNTTSIPNTATSITIGGTGFSTTPANDTVAFSSGAAGTVTAATATSLTVSLTSEIAATGALTAVVTANGTSSGAPVEVANVTATAFTPGDLAVLQLGNTTTNTTGSVLELGSSSAQSAPIQTIGIGSMSFSDSGTSGFLSDTADGSLLAFGAYNTTSFTPGADLATDTASNARGVGTLNSTGSFNLATTYTESTSGDQTRSAVSADDSNWAITDKGGLFTNGATSATLSTNILNARTFGGVIYVSSTKAAAGVSTISSPTATALAALPGVPADAAIQDFYLIRSGSNGATYDVLYTLDQGASSATINKFSLVNGSWVANGTAYTLAANGTSMIAANNGSGGASLYVVTTSQAADNSVVQLTDAAGYNTALNITAAPKTLYTATGTNTLKGIAFAPANLPNFSVSVATPAPGSSAITLTASNGGPAGASGVEVQFTLPAGLTYDSASGTNGFTATQSGGVVTFSGGTLAAGTSATLTVNVTATANSVTIPAGAAVIDPGNVIPEGNEFVNYNTSPVSLNEADLTVDISGPSSAFSNSLIYDLTASNIGSADADGDVTVQFTLPSSTETVTGTTGAGFTESESNGVVTFSGGTIAAGATVPLTVTVSDSAAEVVTAGPGAAVIDPGDTVAESNYSNNSSTTTVATTVFPTFEITGIDVSPVAGTPFTGVFADFQDANDSKVGDFTATINWGDNSSSLPSDVTLAALPTENIVNETGATDTFNLITVTGTHTYAAGTYHPTVTVTNSVNGDTDNVSLNAIVAYAPLKVLPATIAASANTPLTNQVVATFTDPGLVANMASLGITDPTTQFSTGIDWNDNSAATTGTVTYDTNTKVFSVTGSHTYSQTGSFSPSVTVTPLTVSVVQVDSSDPTNKNLAIDTAEGGDEASDQWPEGNGLTDAAGPIFVDQFAQGSNGQPGSLYTFSLPTVATTSGNYALTGASYSGSEDELSLSSNNQYLVLAGYDATANLWAAQPVYNSGTTLPRVIGTIDGQGDINTTTGLTNAFVGDNFRGAVSVDGQEFWSVGHTTLSGAAADGNIEYSTLDPAGGASTMITSGNPSNTNTDEIFNGQLYMASRKEKGLPAGIIQVGTGLPTGTNTPETSFIAVPQTDPFNVYNYVTGETGATGLAGEPTGPFSFYMADLNDGNPTVNGVNVAYVADSTMGIARYDHTSNGWQFAYYIDSTGTINDSDYNVDSTGQVSVSQAAVNGGFTGGTADGDADFAQDKFVIDPSKAGGVTGLTGRVVNGQVQLFASTGYGSSLGFNPTPDGSVIAVTDTGANSQYTKLATASGTTEYRGVALTPSQTVSSSVQVSAASTTTSITSTSVTGYHQTSASANDLVSLTASVVTGSNTPVNGGTVTFSIYQGTNTNVAPVATATSTAVASGVATASLNVTGLAIGSYTITASYGGTTNFAASPASNTGTLQIVTPLTAAQEANISSIALNSATIQPVSFTPPTASDALGAVNWSFSANGVNFTNSNGTWTGTNFPVGTTTVTGVASDAYGNSISQMFTVTVTPAAQTGAIQAVGSKFGKPTSFTQSVSVSHLSAGTYYYALSGLPPGVTLSSATGGTVTTYNNLPAIKFTITSGGTDNFLLTFSDPSAVAFNQYQWSIGS